MKKALIIRVNKALHGFATSLKFGKNKESVIVTTSGNKNEQSLISELREQGYQLAFLPARNDR